MTLPPEQRLGFLYGFANTMKTMQHYCEKWGARYVGMLHPNHVEWDEKTAQELIRKYKLEDPKK